MQDYPDTGDEEVRGQGGQADAEVDVSLVGQFADCAGGHLVARPASVHATGGRTLLGKYTAAGVNGAWFDELLDLGDRDTTRHRRERIEVHGDLAEHLPSVSPGRGDGAQGKSPPSA